MDNTVTTAGSSAPKLDTGTKLAIDRTRLAHERTLMAWIRTAVSLISFGFTIYKFFQIELAKTSPAPQRLIGARGFALMMIGIGLAALLMASIDHRRSLQAMRAEYGPVPLSTAEVVAVLVSFLGFAALFGVWMRV